MVDEADERRAKQYVAPSFSPFGSKPISVLGRDELACGTHLLSVNAPSPENEVHSPKRSPARATEEFAKRFMYSTNVRTASENYCKCFIASTPNTTF